VDQLRYFKDSVLGRMDSVRKALNIKDRNMKSLLYISSTASRTDTILVRDTIFQKPARGDGTVLDTLVGDAWYRLDMKLRYPDYIAVRPWFKSQRYVTVSTRKETVNPPKKLWLLRLFQRKHEVVTVNVVEENPYIQDSVGRYVEILR